MKTSVSRGANPIGQRLKLEMQKQGVTSAQLAKRADVKTSFIYDVLSGKSANPSTVKLARVAEGLGIGLTQLVEAQGVQARKPVQLRDDDYVSIPRMTVEVSPTGKPSFRAGHDGLPFCFRSQWIKEHLGVSPDKLRVLTVHGDSMEPSLCHNDVVLVDTGNKTAGASGIFIIFDGRELVAKRLEYVAYSEPARIRVISDNPQYSSYELSPEEAIIGRVVWFGREI